ncbi:jerky protein homolog-like [Onthophagus taurus]|uniref:jerky protein homolog-like n=1 Tax=Onthophagus taurus TaxID=166361 RepID=UPI0039BE98A6
MEEIKIPNHSYYTSNYYLQLQQVYNDALNYIKECQKAQHPETRVQEATEDPEQIRRIKRQEIRIKEMGKLIDKVKLQMVQSKQKSTYEYLRRQLQQQMDSISRLEEDIQVEETRFQARYFEEDKRYGIREIGLHGEKLSGDQQAADDFQRDFEKFVMSEDLLPEQIYNADESGLFWKCLPTRTLAFESEHKVTGHKSSKERITILPCSNAAGTHKLKLLVIGKSKKPRSFKGTTADNLPVDYFNQKKGWMNQQIFQEWFEKIFVPQVRKHLDLKNLPRKAVLLIDTLQQPMDQGVIATVNRIYRTKLVKTKIEEGYDFKQLWKMYTILDSIYDIAFAWDCIKPSTLVKSWRKLFPNIEVNVNQNIGEEHNEDMPIAALIDLVTSVPGGENVNQENIEEWLECDKNELGFERLSDVEITNKAMGVNEENEEIESEEGEVLARMTHETALQHVDGLLQYLEEQDDAHLAEKLMLRNVQSRIKKRCFQSKKQKLVTDFFKKM